MADMLESIDNLPDISFIDNLTLEEVQALLLNAFYENYKAITGKDGRIVPATFAVIKPDGSIARAPCHVDLALDTVAFDEKRPEISDGDERLLIGGKMLNARRTPFENGIDKIKLSV